MKRQTVIASNNHSTICPRCEVNELDVAHCNGCDRSISAEMLNTLKQIIALPDAIGKHTCECGHPEM